MNFAEPAYLAGLVLIPLLVIFLTITAERQKNLLKHFAASSLWPGLLPGFSMRLRRIKMILVLSSLALMIVALSGPQWGFHWEEVKRRGVDVVVALDLSKSMLAEDLKPTRLEAAKREVKDLLQRMEGDRIGIVGFSGNAFLSCPLTLDYHTAKIFVDTLDTDSIPLGGTDLAKAIRTGAQAFEGHEKKHRVMILITDGESHEGDVMRAVEEAKSRGVVIHTVGAGHSEGAPIPQRGDDASVVYVKDASGQIVLSKLNMDLLRKIAVATGGKSAVLGSGTFPLEEIYTQEVRAMDQKVLESKRQKRMENRFQVPLAMALLLLVIEMLIPERRFKTPAAGVKP